MYEIEDFEFLTSVKFLSFHDRKFIDEQKAAFTSLRSQVFKDKQAVYWYATCSWHSFHVTLQCVPCDSRRKEL